MKILFFILLISTANALSPVMLRMSPNREFMSFYLQRFFDLSRKNFNFPEENALLKDLVSEIDHWLIPGTPYYQITLSFGINAGKESFRRVRVAVPEKFRKDPRLTDPSLPGKDIVMVEWEGTRVCVLLNESAEKKSGWCREKKGPYQHSFDEVLVNVLPEGWPQIFPRFDSQVVLKTVNGEAREASFFQVAAHPSGIPEALLATTNIFVRDAHLPLNRITTGNDGTFVIQYP